MKNLGMKKQIEFALFISLFVCSVGISYRCTDEDFISSSNSG